MEKDVSNPLGLLYSVLRTQSGYINSTLGSFEWQQSVSGWTHSDTNNKHTPKLTPYILHTNYSDGVDGKRHSIHTPIFELHG